MSVKIGDSVVHTKTARIATVSAVTADGVTIVFEDGKDQILTNTLFTRWWKVTDVKASNKAAVDKKTAKPAKSEPVEEAPVESATDEQEEVETEAEKVVEPKKGGQKSKQAEKSTKQVEKTEKPVKEVATKEKASKKARPSQQVNPEKEAFMDDAVNTIVTEAKLLGAVEGKTSQYIKLQVPADDPKKGKNTNFAEIYRKRSGLIVGFKDTTIPKQHEKKFSLVPAAWGFVINAQLEVKTDADVKVVVDCLKHVIDTRLEEVAERDKLRAEKFKKQAKQAASEEKEVDKAIEKQKAAAKKGK